MLSDYTKETFFNLLVRDFSIKDFEKWVYNNSDHLEKELQEDLHLDLISLNYNSKDSFYLIQDKIMAHIDSNEFNIWRVKNLLVKIINNNIDLVIATQKLRELYYDTDEKLIPIRLGLGYESEIGDYPTPDKYYLWEKEALKKKLELVEAYKDDIISDSKDLLKELNK